MTRLAALAFVLLSVSAFAEELSPEKAAKIQLEEERATEGVAKKYGNKKLSEMSNDERSRMAQDQSAAQQKVLDDNGVDTKSWARYSATMSPEQQGEMKQAREALLKKEEAEKKAAAEKAKQAAEDQKKQQDVEVQKGFSEGKPTVMEESKDAPPMIEKGLPEGEGEEKPK